tara:strand:- start:25 stop:825 length:801 start_codon:yes stop_codon:yes gene_type:complete
MAKEAVVEEPKEVVETTNEKTNEVEEELSSWYYFFSQGCGWCKKTSPIVDELINGGHDILMLDLAEPDNQKLNNELKAEFKTQCGTPWFINADTGKGICGFREKDVLEKWLNGEDIPAPPRPTGPPPKPPLMGATKKEENKWKKEYEKWLKDNEHLPENRKKPADEILSQPRPKSDPPRPPMGPQSTDEDIDKWGEEYKKWSEENKHLPNLQPVDKIVQNMKNRKNQMVNTPQGNPNQRVIPGNLEQRMTTMEQKLDKLINHLGVK